MRRIVLMSRPAPLWGALLLLLTATTAAGMTKIKILENVEVNINAIESLLEQLEKSIATTTSTPLSTTTPLTTTPLTTTPLTTTPSTTTMSTTTLSTTAPPTTAPTSTALSTTAPSTTTPSTTTPSTTTPSTTTPSTTTPSTTTPSTTTPSTTTPSTTTPSTTAPSTTAPSTTAPSTTAPSTTAPSTTAPPTTTPTSTLLSTTTPSTTTPSTTTPSTTTPPTTTPTPTPLSTTTSPAGLTTTTTVAPVTTTTVVPAATTTVASDTMTVAAVNAPWLKVPLNKRSLLSVADVPEDCEQCVILFSAVEVATNVSEEIAERIIYEKQVDDTLQAKKVVETVVNDPSAALEEYLRNNGTELDEAIQSMKKASSVVRDEVDRMHGNKLIIIVSCSVVAAVILIAIVSAAVHFRITKKKKMLKAAPAEGAEGETAATTKRDDRAPLQEDAELFNENGGIDNYAMDVTPIRAALKSNNTFNNTSGWGEAQQQQPVQRVPDTSYNGGMQKPPRELKPRQEFVPTAEQHHTERPVPGSSFYERERPEYSYAVPHHPHFKHEEETLSKTENRRPGNRLQPAKHIDSRRDSQPQRSRYIPRSKSYFSDDGNRRSQYKQGNRYSDEENSRKPQLRSQRLEYALNGSSSFSPQGRRSHNPYSDSDAEPKALKRHTRDRPRSLSPRRRPSHNPYSDSDAAHNSQHRHTRTSYQKRQGKDEHSPQRKDRSRSPRKSHRSDRGSWFASPPLSHDQSPTKSTIPRVSVGAGQKKDTVNRRDFRRPYGYEDLY